MRRYLAILTFLAAVAQPTSADSRDVVIGVWAPRGAEHALARWSPTAEYLSEQLRPYRFTIRPLDLDALEAAVRAGELDFILTNPGQFVGLEHRFGSSRLLTLRNRHLGAAYTVFGAAIITRAGRDDIRSLQDLRGKSFAAPSPDAFGCFQIAWRELNRHGIDPFRDFSRLIFSGFPNEQAVYLVRDGLADAATVRSDVFYQMAEQGLIELDAFRIVEARANPAFPVLHSTQLYPEWPLVKAAHTSDQLAQSVAVALLTMPAEHSAALAGRYAGWTIPQDYQPVEQLLKELELYPYEQDIRFWHFARSYWHLMVVALAVLLGLAALVFFLFQLNRRHRLARVLLENEISERQHAEAEMHKLTSALAQTADAVMITDRGGVIEYVNPAFEATTGYTRQEACGQRPSLLKSGYHDGNFYWRLWTTLLGGEVFRDVFINRRKDGTFFYEEKTITPLKDEQGNIVYFVSTGRDITERTQAEERARQHEAQLAQVFRISTMGEMTSALAHELNQPLSAIVNYAQGAVRRLQTGTHRSEDLQAALEHIAEQGQRSGEIIRRLRNFTRESSAQRAPADINQIAREAADLGSMVARQKRVAIDLELAEDLPAVLVDEIQIEQVILNLLRNSIEAMTGSEPTQRRVRITTSRGRRGDVRVEVRDTGPGLPIEHLDLIFDAFFTTKSEGMGMGLSISRSIIEAHGGSLVAESGLGGATFSFTLPSAVHEESDELRVQDNGG